MRFTVLGGSGFVGAHLVEALVRQGMDTRAPSRDEPLRGRDLGHVVDCIGLTADFRERPFETVEAHVGRLARVLQEAEFESFLYLSSTRVYAGALRTDEDATLAVNPNRADDLYALSKLLGESLCLTCGRASVRVARLSNVFGPGRQSPNFLSAVLRDAVQHHRVHLRTTLDSSKDYVNVADVVAVLPRIARAGRHSIYNVGSGTGTTHGELLGTIQRLIGCAVTVAPDAETVRFPLIDCSRIRAEFGFQPASVLDSLESLISCYQRDLC